MQYQEAKGELHRLHSQAEGHLHLCADALLAEKVQLHNKLVFLSPVWLSSGALTFCKTLAGHGHLGLTLAVGAEMT